MKKIFIFALGILVLASFAAAQSTISEPSVCCEKTNEGAWCINTDEDNCDAGFKLSPTSCDSTSYCKEGTCYDSEEGICMENTPQRVCSEEGGAWDARGVDDLPQCQLGCCIIVDQAAFVPLVRCKRLSSLFGVEIDYRMDISSEIDCIAEAQGQDMGACVFEKDFERTCIFTTKRNCNAPEEVLVEGENASIGSGEKKFYKDYLCSAEELGTACGKQASTGCYQQKVYWLDSCGNRENVYSGSGSGKEKSWNNGKVLEPDEICDPNDGSDKTCGNCDYLLGTRCSKWTSFLGIGKPAGSDYFCKRTECKDRNGRKRKNGESWCVVDSTTGNGTDPVGSRYFRELCVDGEVRVEACEDKRAQICLEGSISTDEGAFGVAACRVNRWQDCVLQTKEDDCKNIDKRDCMWLNAVTGMILGGGSGGQFSNPTADQEFSNPALTGSAIFGGDDDEDDEPETTTNRPEGICVSNYPPGLKFWEDGESKGICGIASAQCVVTYEKRLVGGESCVENCECLEDDWALEANQVCVGLGDCGGYVNYEGEYTEDGYEWKVDGEEEKFSKNQINKITAPFTGRAIGVGVVQDMK